MWYLLAECEERYLRATHQGLPQKDLAVTADATINLARWPLRWLWQDCGPKGDLLRHHVVDGYYDEAKNLADLGRMCEWFEAAFSYATWGHLSLVLDGRYLRPIWATVDHVRHDACDRLRNAAEQMPDENRNRILSDIAKIVADTVTLRNKTFDYALNPGVFNRVYGLAERLLDGVFRSPGLWKLSSANLAQYTAVLKALWALSAIHWFARVATSSMGYNSAGYARALVVMERDELIARLRRYLSLDEPMVRDVIEELTFGRRVECPDIALQPLVPLEPCYYGWAPSLVMNSSFERNLFVLLNKLPAGKKD